MSHKCGPSCLRRRQPPDRCPKCRLEREASRKRSKEKEKERARAPRPGQLPLIKAS